ncbi:MAG: carbon-nitrogen hydrolase, partial [Euryarchaeota archaeon]|nr:carbon-nitrogen hydrolase [Euryarchaeota archaeon]
MRVALAQIPCVLGDKEANLGRMRRTMSRVEADLYVFPELFLTGYMVRDEIYRLAECMDGPSIAAVGAMAAETGAHVLFGMAFRDSMVPGVLRNSAVLISPLG